MSANNYNSAYGYEEKIYESDFINPAVLFSVHFYETLKLEFRLVYRLRFALQIDKKI